MEIVFSVFLSMFVIDGVCGVDPDGVKTVIEGDSLTLQTDFTEMQKDGLTEWKVNKTSIATINKGTGKVEYSDDKLIMMFSGRINLDQTGFLTIWNIRIKHSGEYTVESVSSVGTKSKTFKVIVKESPLKSVEDKDEIKVLSATKGHSETLHTETELQKHDLILWRFGADGSLIAKGDTEDNHTSYYDGDDERFRGKLELDSKTGSLTITDLKTKHTGEFRLKIISDRRILFKRFTVTVSALGLSPGAVAGIFVGILLAVAAAVAAGLVIYCGSNRYKLKKLMSKFSEQLKQMTNISKQLEKMTKTNEKDLEEISKQLKQMTDISENEKTKISEKIKQMAKGIQKEMPKLTEQLKQLREQNIPEQLFEMSEQVNQMTSKDGTEMSQQKTYDDVTQEETPRSELREGERKRLFVEETAISKAIGADRILQDIQGRKSIAIRAEDEVHIHYDDVTQEETPRPEIREGERKRLFVEETAISKAIGADEILRDIQGRKSIAIRAEDEVHIHDLTGVLKISEQETRADVTEEETIRPEIKEGEVERFIYVQETAISKAFGADKRLRDRQGKKSLVIRKTNTEDAGVQTHGTDEKAPENVLKELKEELKEEPTEKEMTEETPFMSQDEEDASND
ncbi:uncharacterized protein [Garra rufa]|uniref:uncharacterized protein n=1 Tax=Garra rufa TaxID=137080 RepID=UPI003CCEB614